MPLFKPCLVLIEILILIAALSIYWQKKGYGISTSLCYAIIICFGFYSASIQLFFIIHIIQYYYVVDILVFLISLYFVINNLKLFLANLTSFVGIFRQNKILLSPFLLLYIYLLIQVLLLPPSNNDSMSYNLTRVLLMKDEGTLFLNNYTSLRQVNLSLGYDIMNFLFLRFNSDWFLAIFSMLCYAVIIFGTYALVSKFDSIDRTIRNNLKLSLITSIVISSLIELVLQATSTKNDIGTAAVAVVCFLAGYNFLYESDRLSLKILITSLLIGVSFKGYFVLFALPFSLFILYYSLKRFSLKLLLSYIKMNYLFYLLPFAIFIFFSLFVANNYINYGGFVGNPKYFNRYMNHDGLEGAAINACRYVIQGMEYPTFLGGNFLKKAHDTFLKKKASIGSLEIFIKEMPLGNIVADEDTSWYGPLGFLLIIPAIIYSLFKGSGYVRLTALSLVSFYLLICYSVAWNPYAGRLFSLFYAASGLNVAFLLSRLRFKNFNYLIIASSLILCFAALFNYSKSFFNVYEISYWISNNIYKISRFEEKKHGFTYPGPYFSNWLQYVIDRKAFYNLILYRNDALNKYQKLIKHNSRILILNTEGKIFPFVLYRSDLNKIVSMPKHIYINGKLFNINNPEDLKFLKNEFDYVLYIGNDNPKSLTAEKVIFHYPKIGRGIDDSEYWLYKLSK